MNYSYFPMIFIIGIINYLIVWKYTKDTFKMRLKDCIIILFFTMWAVNLANTNRESTGLYYINIIFLNSLICFSLIDMKKMEVPDMLLLEVAIIICFLRFYYERNLNEYLAYGIVSFLMMYLIYNIYKGQIGGGDVKLIGLMGLVYGMSQGYLAVFIASCVALLYYLSRLINRKQVKDLKIPFIPFITIGIFISYYLDVYNIIH